jgi:transcriptional regulator of acetoin/glycerol metabolism
VLQDREVTPLGGSKSTKVDFLPICATHRPLRELVAAGQFRADLYYRLAHFVVELPALREIATRGEILSTVWRQLTGGAGPQLSAAAETALAHYHWPGNFRQLVSTMRTLAALAHPGETVGVDDLPTDLRNDPRPDEGALRLDDITDNALRQALKTAGGNVSRAARTLGVDRSTFYRRSITRSPDPL